MIIPPTTTFFKVKFSKKGLIAPGLSENIHITFSPESYVYYYDYVRIFCEGEKMVIPIHAFPKMNIHCQEYFPKFINFGAVHLNTEKIKSFKSTSRAITKLIKFIRYCF